MLKSITVKYNHFMVLFDVKMWFSLHYFGSTVGFRAGINYTGGIQKCLRILFVTSLCHQKYWVMNSATCSCGMEKNGKSWYEGRYLAAERKAAEPLEDYWRGCCKAVATTKQTPVHNRFSCPGCGAARQLL